MDRAGCQFFRGPALTLYEHTGLCGRDPTRRKIR
jgi:hypothetical protein